MRCVAKSRHQLVSWSVSIAIKHHTPRTGQHGGQERDDNASDRAISSHRQLDFAWQRRRRATRDISYRFLWYAMRNEMGRKKNRDTLDSRFTQIFSASLVAGRFILDIREESQDSRFERRETRYEIR